jgi:protein TonB
MDTEKNNPYKGGEHIEVKKSSSANLEKNKTTWLLIGLVVVFALMYIALEFTTFEEKKVQPKVKNEAKEIKQDAIQEFKIVRPPQPQVQQQKPTEVKEIIKVLEKDSEQEESELVAPEDMGQEEYVDVEYTGDIVVEEEVEEEEIFMSVQDPASFPGGMQELYKYLSDNIKYPAVSRNNNSQGKTILRFIVNTDGSITGIEVMKSSGDMYLDKEAVRVVTGMPKWKPGVQNGRSVRCYFVLPVTFRLQ